MVKHHLCFSEIFARKKPQTFIRPFKHYRPSEAFLFVNTNDTIKVSLYLPFLRNHIEVEKTDFIQNLNMQIWESIRNLYFQYSPFSELCFVCMKNES